MDSEEFPSNHYSLYLILEQSMVVVRVVSDSVERKRRARPQAEFGRA